MGFEALKRGHQARRNKRPPSCASAILRVAEVDKEQETVMVELPANAAAALGVENGPWPLELRLDPKHAKRQPTRKDLLGLPGAVSKSPMEVEPGSTIIGDNLTIEDGKASVSWFLLGSGPVADQKAGGPADILEGYITVSRRRFDDTGEVKVSCDIVQVDRAETVSDVDGLQASVRSVLEEDGPGSGYAIVRFSSSKGETLHKHVRSRRNEDGGMMPADKVAGEATESMRAEVEEAARVEKAGTATIEVIPARSVSIGGETQSQLLSAFEDRTGKRMNTGSRKFKAAEIHPSDRMDNPRNLKVDQPASQAQLDFVERLADERGVEVPAAARSSSAAASAWIDEKKLVLGFAPGQLVVRSGIEGREGELYSIAIASALHRRSGVRMAAVPTPGCPNAPEFARGMAQEASANRADLMAGKVPESLSRDENQPEDAGPSIEPDPEPEIEDEDFSGPGFGF